MKYKITIFVFLALVFLYFLHFVITYDRTKETFVEEHDDIEHYEEPKATLPPPTKPASTTYDMRIMILDDIEKLNLTDKSLKGKLMQEVFADEAALKTLESKTSDERLSFVKSKLETLKTKDEYVNVGDSSAGASTSVSATSTTASPPVITAPKTSVPESKDVMVKAEEALAHLQKVEANLKQIQSAFGQQQMAVADSKKTNAAETNIPDNIPASTATVKSNFTEPSIPQSFIEGFESIRNYASIF